MALTSTLFTGLSGLNVNQTRLNVVGNNIANVNTVAFKSSRALFTPQFYVTESGGTPPSDQFGGANPSQRGLGATVAAIEKDFSAGSIESTGKVTDMAIDGEGFFILQGDGQVYTRNGTFSLNSEHQLVATNGDFVQGYGVDDNGNVISGTLTNVTIPLGTFTSAKATENVTLEGNLNTAGPLGSGASILLSQPLTTVGGAAKPVGTTLLTSLALADDNSTALFVSGDVLSVQGQKGGRDMAAKTMTVTATSTLADLESFFQNSMGIDTTVTSTNPSIPTPGAVLKDVTGNATAVQMVLTGNVGEENALTLTGNAFTKVGGGATFTFADGANAAGITSNPVGESVHTSFVVYDSLGTPVTIDVTTVLESRSDTGNTWRFYATSAEDTDASTVLGNGTLVFDSEGHLASSTGSTIRVDRANTGAQTTMSVKLDFGSMTSLTGNVSELRMSRQDGYAIGNLSSFSIGADGTITGSFTNGLTRSLGQLALATFKNPKGLVDQGGNLYTAGPDSGVAIIASPGMAGAGLVRAGALEQSNVDLSAEFINLIIASTGFSASSRVISASNQLLTELLNTQR